MNTKSSVMNVTFARLTSAASAGIATKPVIIPERDIVQNAKRGYIHVQTV